MERADIYIFFYFYFIFFKHASKSEDQRINLVWPNDQINLFTLAQQNGTEIHKRIDPTYYFIVS